MRSVAVNKSDEIFVTGEFTSILDFGADPLDNVSGDDVFLAKLPP